MPSASPHFSKSELQCPCCQVCNMDGDFLFALEALRAALVEKLAVLPKISLSSAYRCPKHNAAVGGVADSQHLTGKAVDIVVANAGDRYQVVKAALSGGFRGIGIAETFVHVDDRPANEPRVIWIYPPKKRNC